MKAFLGTALLTALALLISWIAAGDSGSALSQKQTVSQVAASFGNDRLDQGAATTARSSRDATSAQVREPANSLVAPVDLGSVTDAFQRKRSHPHPHGKRVCASGCAASNHPTPQLRRETCRRLLAAYQATPVGLPADSLDKLLFYGSQTRRWLNDSACRALLDQEHYRLLSRELRRRRVAVSIRLVDEHGNVRAELPSTSVVQHIRQVFDLDVNNLQPLVCSGTVKRVGLNHVWQRL